MSDSGILHCLLGIESHDDLLGHPVRGASWEGLCIETIAACSTKSKLGFLRTSNGAEIDLVRLTGDNLEIFEFKASKAPQPSRGFFTMKDTLHPQRSWIIAPVDEAYPYGRDIWVSPLAEWCKQDNN